MTKYYDEFVFEGPVTGSGGGGCFTESQLVFTSHGWKPISRLVKGDLVVAFDVSGELDHGYVNEVFKHSKAENNSGIYLFTFGPDNKTLEVTGNHAIYFNTGTDVPFKQAKDFIVGDVFVDDEGNEQTISEIVSREIRDDEFTYNLSVTPQHTYIVQNVRVHNGGGGKGGGSSRAAVEDKNTLRSTQIARVMEVISEGPIWGLTTSDMQSVYFNDTPVQNSDTTYNFSIKQGDFRTGNPSQPYVQGYNGVSSVNAIGTTITTAISVTHSNLSSTDAVVVQLRLPSGLFTQDTTTGDTHGGQVQIAIDSRPTAGVWTTIISPIVKGKTTTTYDTSYRISRPTGATTWDVRIRRVTADSSSMAVVDATQVYQITEVQEIQLPYNGVAYAAVALDAQSVGNQIPVRSYDVKGMICQIPSNYNPITRVYTGTWGGTFTTGWTDNPAWILYDLLTDVKYGMGSYINTATIDVWSFYAASQYNDALVNDGNGGTEPRFTYNNYISTREDGWKLIQAIASSMRAVVIPGGIIELVQDRPSSPVRIITNSNVKDGIFTYQSSGLMARHTACNVTFNDKTDRYLPRVISVEDTGGIARYGYNLLDIQAVGCTSEGQARRLGKWALDTEMNQTEVVSFDVGFNQADVNPGDVLYVMDNDYVTQVFAGRTVGGTTTSLITDAPVTLTAGNTYTLALLDLDGATIVTRTITNTAGTYTTFNLSSALPNSAALLNGREWMITSATAVNARQFRVLAVKENSPGQFGITAVYYDPNKYSRVESGVTNPGLVYTTVTQAVCGSVTGITGVLESKVDQSVGVVTNLRLSWTKPSTPVAGYRVSYSRDNGPFTPATQCDNNSLTLQGILQGVYVVTVTAYNMAGVQSAPATNVINAYFSGGGGVTNLLPVTNLQLTTGGTSSAVQDFTIQWTNPTGNNNISSVLKDFIVTIKNGATVIRTDYAPLTTAGGIQTYTYTNVMNTTDNGGLPIRSINVSIQARDTQFSVTSATTATFSNPAPSVPGTITNITGSETISFFTSDTTPPSDFVGTVVYGSTTTGFTPGPANLLASIPGKIVNVSVINNTQYYFRVGWYDSFGQISLNVSAEIPLKSLVTGVVPTPNTPTGLALSTVSVVNTDGSVTSSLKATWSAGTDSPATYTLSIRDITGSGTATTVSTTGLSYTWTGLKNNNNYGVQVREDNTGVSGAYCTEVTQVSAVNSTPPGAPTGLAATASFKNVWLTWTNSSDNDLDHCEVWAATTNNRASATLVGSDVASPSSAGSFVHSSLTTGSTYYYWVREVNTSNIVGTSYYPAGATAGISVTPSQVATADYQNLSIVNAAIANLAVDNTKIANATIGSAQIANAAIGTAQIANLAVDNTKIANATITSAQIANATITSAQIANATITSAQIANATIGSAQIASAAIATAQIQSGAITTALIGNAQVGTAQIANASITGALISNLTVDTINLKNGSISDTQIMNATIPSQAVTLGYTNTATTAYFTAASPSGISGTFTGVLNWYVNSTYSNPSYNAQKSYYVGVLQTWNGTTWIPATFLGGNYAQEVNAYYGTGSASDSSQHFGTGFWSITPGSLYRFAASCANSTSTGATQTSQSVTWTGGYGIITYVLR